MEVENEKGYLFVSMQPDGKIHSMNAELICHDEGSAA